MSNLRYHLAFNRMNSIGPRTVKKLQNRWPVLQELFELSPGQMEQAGLPNSLAQIITGFDFKLIEADLNWLAQHKTHHLLSWDCAAYPSLLKEISDPPIILYAVGQLDSLLLKPIAMVGSRNPSVTGSENAYYFAKELASYAVSIVSGLALGVDAQAHKGCLAAQGKTIAVLGTGIDCIYPRRHLALAEQIVQNGLLLSEFPLKSPPIAGHFPRRNRIISGLSLCTLVVEAAIKSGSLITAKMALEQNRDVLAIPGSIHNPMARGCHHLLQQGAKLVASVGDVLDELKIVHQANTIDKPTFSLASGLENLVKFIGFEITSIEQIISRSGFSVEHVTSELATLELLGAVISVPGGYMRCEHER